MPSPPKRSINSWRRTYQSVWDEHALNYRAHDAWFRVFAFAVARAGLTGMHRAPKVRSQRCSVARVTKVCGFQHLPVVFRRQSRSRRKKGCCTTPLTHGAWFSLRMLGLEDWGQRSGSARYTDNARHHMRRVTRLNRYRTGRCFRR